MPRKSFYSEEMVQITLRFPVSTFNQLNEIALKEERSVNQVVIRLVQKGLESLQKEQSEQDD